MCEVGSLVGPVWNGIGSRGFVARRGRKVFELGFIVEWSRGFHSGVPTAGRAEGGGVKGVASALVPWRLAARDCIDAMLYELGA